MIFIACPNHHCYKSWQNYKVFFVKIQIYFIQLVLEMDFEHVLVIFCFLVWRKTFSLAWHTQTYPPSNRGKKFTEIFIKELGNVCHSIRLHCPHQYQPSWKIARIDGILKLNLAKFTENFKCVKSEIFPPSMVQLCFMS